MLGKLLKYEIKATGRIFLPLYAVLFLFAIITRIFNPGAGFNSEFQAGSGAMQITGGIMMAAYVSIIVAIFVVTVVMMIQRFYKNLLSDEGYLMFTLPVRPWKHIASKLIVSVLWIVVSGIVTMLSVAVLVSTWELWKAIPDAFAKLIEMINQYFGASGYWFGLEMLLLMLTSLVLGILLIYAAIALGHLFTRHRTLFGLGAFLALNTVSQWIIATVGKIIGETYPALFTGFTTDLAANHWLLWLGVFSNLVFGTAYFAITNYVLSKRLNLE